MKLEKGDIVDIIAPASGCTEAEYDKAIEFVRKFGLTPRFREYNNVIKPGLCANTIDYRFEHLMDAIESESKAIWCLKGGYGSQKLLKKLDGLYDNPPEEKIFIGFSDITILLNHFSDRWGWTPLHGPMPGQVGTVSEDTWQRLADIVFGKVDKVEFAAKPLNKAATKTGLVQGKFVGGCLSLLQALIGTEHMLDLECCVLLLEDDRFETPRRIDRILDQMKRANMFNPVEAVVLGNFLESPDEGSKDASELKEVLESFADYLDEKGIPLIQNTKLGHSEDMLTLPIGAYVEVKLGEKTEVEIRV